MPHHIAVRVLSSTRVGWAETPRAKADGGLVDKELSCPGNTNVQNSKGLNMLNERSEHVPPQEVGTQVPYHPPTAARAALRGGYALCVVRSLRQCIGATMVYTRPTPPTCPADMADTTAAAAPPALLAPVPSGAKGPCCSRLQAVGRGRVDHHRWWWHVCACGECVWRACGDGGVRWVVISRRADCARVGQAGSHESPGSKKWTEPDPMWTVSVG